MCWCRRTMWIKMTSVDAAAVGASWPTVTICRSIVRHKDLLEDLFAQVVGLAAEAGLIDVTLVAVDGTKLPGDASVSRNKQLGDLRQRFVGWADELEANDAVEDAAEADDPDGGPIAEMFERSSMQGWIRRRLRERAADPDDVTANASDSTMLVPMVTHIGGAVTAATGQSVGVVVADGGYWTTSGITTIEADDELPDVLVATGRHRPEQPPAPLPAPDADAHQAPAAAINDDAAAQRAHRITVIARVVNGELMGRQAAELLGISAIHVSAIKQAWIKGAGRPGPPGAASSGNDKPSSNPSSVTSRPTGASPASCAAVTTSCEPSGIWILAGHNLTIMYRRAG